MARSPISSAKLQTLCLSFACWLNDHPACSTSLGYIRCICECHCDREDHADCKHYLGEKKGD